MHSCPKLVHFFHFVHLNENSHCLHSFVYFISPAFDLISTVYVARRAPDVTLTLQDCRKAVAHLFFHPSLSYSSSIYCSDLRMHSTDSSVFERCSPLLSFPLRLFYS